MITVALSEIVPLLDIDDAYAFCVAAVWRLGLALSDSDRQDLVDQGLLVLCELRERFAGGSFAGYARTLIDGRLKDYWHKREEDVRRRMPDGTRRWEPRQLCSLDAELERPTFSERGMRRMGRFEPIQR